MSASKGPLEGRVSLVTGGNRGIGFEVCHRLAELGSKVVLTSRNGQQGQEAQLRLRKLGVEVDFCILDVTKESDIINAKQFIERTFGRLDILVNNAGILPDNTIPGQFSDTSILETPLESFVTAFQTNALAAVRICQALVPLMKANKWGRIVNVSSLVAQLATMDSGIPAYRISKVALNGITRILADELGQYGILCNCVSPGWVKTDMGGPQATVPVAEGAKPIVDLCCLPDSGPTGAFFRGGEIIPW